MDFANIKKITILEGEVKEIEYNGVMLWKKQLLPDEYQEVEYIISDAGINAYLDLGFTFDTACNVF